MYDLSTSPMQEFSFSFSHSCFHFIHAVSIMDDTQATSASNITAKIDRQITHINAVCIMIKASDSTNPILEE